VNQPALIFEQSNDLIFEQSNDFKEQSYRLDDIALEREDEYSILFHQVGLPFFPDVGTSGIAAGLKLGVTVRG